MEDRLSRLAVDVIGERIVVDCPSGRDVQGRIAARGAPSLEIIDADALRADADPTIAVFQHVCVRLEPVRLYIEAVGDIVPLENNCAVECRRRPRTAHQQPGLVWVPGADHRSGGAGWGRVL